MNNQHIQVICGTDRPQSNTMKVTQRIISALELIAKPQITDLKKFPFQCIIGGKYHQNIPEIEQFNAPILTAKGVVIIVPEYNGGLPGIFKLFYDYLPFPKSLLGKPVFLIGLSSGQFGGIRPLEQLQSLLIYRKAIIFPERIYIPHITSLVKNNDWLNDTSTGAFLKEQLKNFVDFLAHKK